MLKKDLTTIIRKIQNRCCLEDPVKITYYRDEEGTVVFKAFFESLYLPENLRVQNDDIQNMFSVPNVYEYEDDFKILEFNQDEGFVKFVTDNQKFKIVDNYKTANLEEDDFTKSLVHLATKKLNEAFARSQDYILQESETGNERIPDPRNADGMDKKALEQAVANKGEVKNTDEDTILTVIGVTCPLAKSANTVISGAIDLVKKVQNSNPGKAVKVILTVPKYKNTVYESSKLAGAQSLSPVLKSKGYDDTYAWYGINGNNHAATALNTLKPRICKVVWLTNTAKKGIEDNDIPSILSLDQKVPVENADGLVEDTTVQEIEKLETLLNNIVQDASKLYLSLQKKKADKRFSACRAFLEKHNNETKVRGVLSFIKTDFGGKSSVEMFKKAAQDRKKAINDALVNVDNIGNTGNVKTTVKQIQAHMSASYANLVKSSIFNRKEFEASSQGGGGGLFGSMKSGGGKSAASSSELLQPNQPKAEEGQRGYADFEAICFSEDGKSIRSAFSEAMELVWEDLEFEEAIPDETGEVEKTEEQKPEDKSSEDQKAKDKEQSTEAAVDDNTDDDTETDTSTED